MSKAYFVTGTDTGVGKSILSAALLLAAQKAGKSTLGLKPIAAGCESTKTGFLNDDALLLQEYSSLKLSYDQVNPVALKAPIAPHIAALKEGDALSVSRLEGYCRGALAHSVDFSIVEGAGGWRVPLNSTETFADLVKCLELPVILVVGLKLGCLNHALLSAESIRNDGLKIAGWVANSIDPEMLVLKENVDTLKSLIPEPCLGEVPFMRASSPEEVCKYLNISDLL